MAEVALLVVPPGKTRAWLRNCLEAAQPGSTVRCYRSVEAACKPLRCVPRLVLVDHSASVHMRAAVRSLVQRFPGAALVVRGDRLDPLSIDAEIDTGACAHIPASYSGTQVQLVLKLALSGAGHRPVCSPPAMLENNAWDALAPADRKDPQGLRIQNRLTRREVDVLTLVTTGLSNRQTAVRLRIGENTVKAHLAAIFRKLKVDNRSKAILVAQRLSEVRRRLVEQGQRGSDVVASLSRHLVHRHHKCGHMIFRRGDPGGELYYLQRGIVG
jgi:DNA-binding NarL/FixJ family response regulator